MESDNSTVREINIFVGDRKRVHDVTEQIDKLLKIQHNTLNNFMSIENTLEDEEEDSGENSSEVIKSRKRYRNNRGY